MIKGVASQYVVSCGEQLLLCSSRKKVKFNSSNLYIGDFVEVNSSSSGDNTIEKVYDRKNCLIRPPIANIDTVLIMISSQPKPDFLLIDKLIINCFNMGIEVAIAINKVDLEQAELVDKVFFEYSNAVSNIFLLSTLTKEGLPELTEFLSGKLTSLVGQSAVGKTSLLNCFSIKQLEIGELSRNMRGKNTTRHSEIFEISRNTFIIDTPGFSFLTLDIDHRDVKDFYPDFVKLSAKCRFNNKCQHLVEPDCEVLSAISKNEVSRDRYERYKIIISELQKIWKNKY